MDCDGFPPFYTLQQNYQLRQQYLSVWANKLLVRAVQTKQVRVAADDPIFTNAAIRRTAEPELVSAIFKYMTSTQQATQLSSDAIQISFVSTIKAAQLVLQEMKKCMMDNDVYTFAEVRELFSQIPQLSHFNDSQIVQTLEELQKQKQLVIMNGQDYDAMGIKVDLIK